MKSAERKRRMLQYVCQVEPAAVLEEFLIKESPVVIGAMRQTISNMLGTITATPQFFTVTISTAGENLAMLMNTVMLTGYMFKSAEERFRLRTALGVGGSGAAGAAASERRQQQQAGQGAAQQWRQGGGGADGGAGGSAGSSGSGGVLGDAYAPGVQKTRVQGEVLLWHKDNGLEAMAAVEYIERLEAEVARLRAAADAAKPPRLPPAAAWGLDGGAAGAGGRAAGAGAAQAAGERPLPQLYSAAGAQGQQQALAVRPHEDSNELLDFIRALEPSTVGDLTASATPETAAAMDAFVERLLGLGGGADRDALRRAASETDATEMRKLLFWLMVVGWKLRSMEVQIELERCDC